MVNAWRLSRRFSFSEDNLCGGGAFRLCCSAVPYVRLPLRVRAKDVKWEGSRVPVGAAVHEA
jgi:hypothetical protein